MVIMRCALTSWQIGIGDPGLMGWVIVALYVATAILAFHVAGQGPFPAHSAGRERFFWQVLGLILLLLALNKQMDLQSLLTALARCTAQLQGWYENRRIVQTSFILAIVALMLIMLAIVWVALRGTLGRNGLALAGLMIVLTFVAIRAVGFHKMDRLINMRIESIRLNWLLEAMGPIMIMVCGLLLLRAARRREKQQG